jgi:hypothetical protein
VLTIDHLTLDVPNLTDQQGRDLAAHVAAGLAAATGLPDVADLPLIQLDLVADTQTIDQAALARQIVAAVLSAILESGAGAP